MTEVNSFSALEDELVRFNPSEVLIPDSDQDLMRKIPRASSYDGYTFELDQASYLLREQFCVQSLDGFGCSDNACRNRGGRRNRSLSATPTTTENFAYSVAWSFSF